MVKFEMVLAFLLPLAITTENAVAQSDAAPGRGGFEVQARYFNPFNPFRSSRFTANWFGLPQLRSPDEIGTNPFTTVPFSAAVESEQTAPLTASTPAVTDQQVASSASSEGTSSEGTTSEGGGAVVIAMSGSQPPVRSPFRPPPRPPFGP